MSTLLSLSAALGVCLFFSGSPIVQRATLRRRTNPFLKHLAPGDPERTAADTFAAVSWLRPSRAERVALSKRLEAAGVSTSPERFRWEQILWGVASAGLACVVSFALGILGASFDLRALPVFALIFGCVGFLLPEHLLGRKARHRREALIAGLPEAVDLLALSIMAGESVLGAFARVAAVTSGEVQLEFRRVTAEVRGGAQTVEALEGFARRANCPPIARLVDALCVAIERGAPVADVLRTQADDAREAQRRNLLELAGRREILMLIPIVFLLLPTVVIFVFYPGLVSLDLLVP